MHLFDLHADTATRLFCDGLSLTDRALALSADDIPCWDSIHQVFAVFSRPCYSDDASYRLFFKIRRHLLRRCRAFPSLTPILAVEDARLLAKKRSRLRVLYRYGVRILTPVWRGVSLIGGAYDTEEGLTEFGKAVVSDCYALGILPDVSHASRQTFFEIAEAAARHSAPLLASHSDAYAVCPHPRNLTDEQFAVIRDRGGLVGLCLCPAHLSCRGQASRTDLLRHLDHLLSLGGERTVAFGTDFDGTDCLPQGLTHNRDLLELSEDMLRLGYSEELIRRLYYGNATAFFRYFEK